MGNLTFNGPNINYGDTLQLELLIYLLLSNVILELVVFKVLLRLFIVLILPRSTNICTLCKFV